MLLLADQSWKQGARLFWDVLGQRYGRPDGCQITHALVTYQALQTGRKNVLEGVGALTPHVIRLCPEYMLYRPRCWFDTRILGREEDAALRLIKMLPKLD